MFVKKSFFSALFVLLNLATLWCQITLQPVWQTPPQLKVPESVKYDTLRKQIYVSNINGAPTQKNQLGFITKLSLDGKIKQLKWIRGLNAPKGMAIWQNKLYVTDIDRIVEIDLLNGKILRSYTAPAAVFLNDLSVDEKGHVYISDMAKDHSVIYRLSKGHVTVFLKGGELRSPNGLFYWQKTLYVGNFDDGRLLAVDLSNRKIKVVFNTGHGIDGLIRLTSGGFIVSDWSGRTAWITPHKKIVTLLDTHKQKINSADLEYIPQKKLLLIPTFFANRVAAYRLQEP